MEDLMTSAGGKTGSSAGLGVAARVAEPVVLEQVVADLRDLQRRGGIERTLAIGELILNRFFGGDPAGWRDRRRNKNNSVRRLASRKDCPFSKSALNEAVAVYVASLTLPCVRTFGHIGASHVAAVLGLTEDDREPMLARAESGRMSVRELRRAIVQARRAEGERRGRPLLETPARALALVRTAVQAAREALGHIRQEAAVGFPLESELRKEFTDLEAILAEAMALTGEQPSVVQVRRSAAWSQRSA
ncbi:MAG TPA: hypothetical protein VNN72_27890 [Polyangiaceae bacterium]|nr:hypothetical protein [Polyangiaceae bacterium]